MRQRPMLLNIGGHIKELDRPQVMGILNSTPDSFYSGSRAPGEEALRQRVRTLRGEGADIVDIGGYSTRPGAPAVSEAEEWERVSRALRIVREEWAEAIISVDTFRSGVARRSVEEYGAGIINDVGGGTLDSEMFRTVADVKAAYVLMHMRGTPSDMQSRTDYGDVTAEIISDLAHKADQLHSLGVADIIIDPGFGFAKTTEQNFRLLDELGEFVRMGMPVLVGLSRKSMVWRTLGITPEESLNGTTALNMVALERGAMILRVHDVLAARETVELNIQLSLAEVEG